MKGDLPDECDVAIIGAGMGGLTAGALLAKIEPEFERIRASGTQLITMNVDALSAEKRVQVIDELAEAMGSQGRVRVLMHSIAFGNLKLLVSETKRPRDTARALAEKLGIGEDSLQQAIDEVFGAGDATAHGLASAPEYSDKYFLDEGDFARTIHAMGTSLLGWVQDLFQRDAGGSRDRVPVRREFVQEEGPHQRA